MSVRTLLCSLLIAAGGCAASRQRIIQSQGPPAAAAPSQGVQQVDRSLVDVVTVAVPSERAWTDTGVNVQAGQLFHIDATGSVRTIRSRLWDWIKGVTVDRQVGPQGTYVWPRDYRKRRGSRAAAFPLPAMADGPFPAFCLIGRIGDEGRPFYVGAHYDGAADASGRLWLGINDDDLADNHGHFHVAVNPTTAQGVAASQSLPRIEPRSRPGKPLPHARVLLLYIDGLCPDILQEMAQAGFLPNFRRVFIDGGLTVANAFTVFPSNTLISNGSLFTGLFSDSTGVKSQNQFERSTLKSKGQLSEWLPDGFIHKPGIHVLNLLDKYAPENTHASIVKHGVPTLGSRLGRAFGFTTLPIAPLNPPPQWFHCAVNTIGPFGISTRLPLRLDTVNARYTIEELLGNPDTKVIAVWFPMVDKTSHNSPHGQYGAARRDLAMADRYLGDIMKRLHEVRWDRSTYLILISDHGHVGGQLSVNRRCNLPRDWAYQRLGCNARIVGQEWTHPGIEESRFIFFDNQGAGQTKLFLPYGSFFHGAWRRNRLYELTHYQMRPDDPPIDLVESLQNFHPAEWDESTPKPIDLLLVKLDERRVWISREPECQAIIHREEDSSGHELYRYEPIRRLTQPIDGEFHYEPALPDVDPLGYLRDEHFLSTIADPTWLEKAHSSDEWLQATYRTRYPDAVVTMAKFFAWKRPVEDLALIRDPDVMVTASEGWSLRSDDGYGTDHGYPLASSMRMSLFISGPNIPHGTMEAPQRIVNVLPTILEMIDWPYEPAQLDGKAITGIYE